MVDQFIRDAEGGNGLRSTVSVGVRPVLAKVPGVIQAGGGAHESRIPVESEHVRKSNSDVGGLERVEIPQAIKLWPESKNRIVIDCKVSWF